MNGLSTLSLTVLFLQIVSFSVIFYVVNRKDAIKDKEDAIKDKEDAIKDKEVSELKTIVVQH